MVGCHHQLKGQEFEQTPGDNEGKGSLVRCSLHAKLLHLCPTLRNPMDLAHQAPLSMGFFRQE